MQYYLSPDKGQIRLKDISADRNGNIRILSDQGIFMPDNGSLFYAGKLIQDISYPPVTARKVTALATFEEQTLYLDDRHVFSNAWAGKIQVAHGLPCASVFAAGNEFELLISDGKNLVNIDRNGNFLWTGTAEGIKEIIFHKKRNSFLLVFPGKIAEFTSGHEIRDLYTGPGISCASPCKSGEEVVIGTDSGYLFLSEMKLKSDLPCREITSVQEINDQLWFGSAIGAFRLNDDGRYSYYAGPRWLPGDKVSAVEKGPENSILVLTEKGLGQILFVNMTLEEKAMFFEKQVREKNIRYGFNCSSSRLLNGYSSALMSPQPSDNLWTAMYLASQLFRYRVTGSKDAAQNAYEAFEALERLYTVTNIPGLFARSIERDYKIVNSKTEGWEQRELHSGSPAELWLPASDHNNWTWRSTASSDQTVGQIFALTMVLEFSDDAELKSRALKCLDDLMTYIVENDLYIIDVDGKPTLWGKWNPDYVNKFPVTVGDRRLYSSNIIAFLQTAYKFTGKERFRLKAYELMEKYDYLANLARPILRLEDRMPMSSADPLG